MAHKTSQSDKEYMNQSTSFAQVATNLLNVLHGSRKNLRLLLVMFLTLCVSAEVWGAIEVGTYKLVSSPSELIPGSHYVIASGTSGTVYCISNVSNTNNRKTVDATATSNQIIVESTSTIMTFTLGGSSNAWTFSTDNYAGTAGLLAATSSSNNRLGIVTSPGDNGKWAINITDNVAYFVAQGTYSRKYIQYNYNNGTPLFNAYSSVGTPSTYLYKKVTAAYAVTATSNNDSYGTVTVSGTTITATPKDGYRVKSGDAGYTVTSGIADVTNNGDNTFSVTPSSDCTITINFEALPKYTVTLNAGPGTCAASVTETSAGAGVELPTPTLDCGDWKFAGWAEESVNAETTTKPTLIAAGSTYKPTSNITLYAVYQRTETTQGGGSGNYELVTSAPDDWSGTYLIVDGSSKNCFNGSLTALDEGGNYKSVTISNNTITSNTTTDSYSVTISKSTNDGKYYIKTASGYYIGSNATNASNDNELDASTSTKYDNSISINSNNVTIQGPDHILKFFYQSGQSWRFRFYKSTTTQNVRLPQLYKKSSGSSTTTYYHSTPECTTQTSYSVTIDSNIENGTVTANPTSATAGTEIALTATPNKGYQFSSWTVTKKDGGTVEVTNNKFTMPASNVIVSATFVTIPQLDTPTNLQVTNISCNEVTLSWDAVTNISSYTVAYRDSKYTNTKTKIYANTTTVPVAPGTTYDWTVQAIGNGTTYADSQIANGNSFTTSYKITYDVNSGSWTACADGCVAGGEDFTICSTVPTKTGYDFMGWSITNDETAEYQAGETINNVSANTTLYAVWEQPKYTVNWYVNSISKREQTDVEGAALTDIPEPTTADCDNSKVFVGWTTIADYSDATDAPDGMITNTTGMKMPKGGEEYYAVFATSSGGSGSVDYSSTHTSNVPINAGTAITNTNVIIESKEYAATKAGTGSASGSVDVTIPTGTTQLSFHMAGWNGEGGKTITLTGATADPSSFKTIADAGVSGNGKYTLSGDVAQYAYSTTLTNITQETKITFANNGADQRFVIWGVNASTGVSYSDYTTTCDATKAKVTYDLNGGEYESDDCVSQTVTKGQPFNLCSNTPTKEGYTFAGWSDGTTTYSAGASVTASENTTFYATWTPNTITITWYQNYNDCPESETSQYIYDGEEIEMPDDPTREGYKFIGWYTFPNAGTIVTEVGNTNKPTANVTYYARWAQLFTVTFMASGQNYVVQEHKYLSGDNLELPVENPSAANYACDGYIFEGWTEVEKPIEDATTRSLVTIATTIERDQTFYALWKKASTEGAGETILFANFDDNKGTGGNDGKWNDNIATASIQLPANWDHAYGYGANQCIKLGTGSRKGSVTTPALSSLSGKATLSFKAAAWDGKSESTELTLSISGGGTLDKTSVTMTKGAWQTYEVTIKDGTPSTKITFAGKNTSDSRFFLDEVKITTSGSYNYTTLPNCGPTIVAKEGMWVTSANGQSVKVNVPIAVKAFTTTATITGTSANENFVITPLENVNNGINDVVEVTYTPNTANTKESATITLTAKDGETEVSTTTFTLNGRSLPDQFAIVVDKASEYYALPANMPSEGTYTGFGVEVNAGTATAAPKTHLYTARAVHSTRFTENGTALRLVGNNDACLWASTAKDGTGIRNYANISNAKDNQYEWSLYTEDGETYRISCTAVTEEGRILRMYGQKFGMYKSGSDVFHLLPVECTSTPTNIQVSPARVSATISWENADACNVQVLKESTPVQTLAGAVSPIVVTGLTESTTYTFTLTPTDNESCVASGVFTTTGPTIDIVKWETNGILIQVDKDNELNPKVVISGEVEHGDAGGNVADELFFSKYFEAHAENKLLAIFNGTTATIDLTGYTIKSENGTLDLSQFGQTKGKVASNEEIILVYYDANYSAEKCAEEQQGYENWNILTEKSVLAFSGRGSLGLYKNDVLIDVIGSTFPSGELTKIGKSGSPDNCGTDENVRLYIDGVSVNDQSSFFCFNGDNIKTDNVETDYALSTNRCLLIRKNTVTSGANAVATNKATADATCGDVSSTFTTLGSEWSGFRIGSGKSSTDEIKNATCDGLGYVGGFDYNNYYRTLETLDNSKTLEEYTHNAEENTYFIEIEDLAQYSCLNIQLQLADDEGNILTQQTSQVPILVTGEKSTTDPIFSAIVKDSETSDPDYETSKIRCSTCDVVILKDATLTKAAADTENDVNQVRDIYIYPGGKLVVPAEATDFSVNNISLRRVEDEVSMANVQTPLQITSSAANPIYVDLRVNAENWHWFTLPYNCNIANVTWADGSKAIYNADWFLMYYDGESRSNQKSNYESHWKVFEGTTLEAGKGYIVGITGHPTKSKVKYELRFPMAQEVLTAEQTDKTVAVNAWGVKKDIRPNHKGWNLVGNPYMDYYQPNTNGFAGLPLITYADTYDPNTGLWDYEESGNVPFLVIPQDGGWSEYKQELASDVDMQPFTAYFVQVGDPNNEEHSDGMELNASFEADKRGHSSLIRRAPSEVNELENPSIVAVSLTNAKGESDKTTLLIADRFTNEYEMNADFFKWFGDYYTYYTKPVLYTLGADNESRAFNALNEELAAQPVALGMYAAQAGEYIFSLYQRSELSRVEEVWLHDATSDTHTNLMLDNYTFSTSKTDGAGRFSLSVKMKPKIATDIDDIRPGQVWATSQDNEVIINGLNSGLQLWLYDAVGKLLYAEPTTNYQHRYTVPQDGVYFITVKDVAQVRTIKVVVE